MSGPTPLAKTAREGGIPLEQHLREVAAYAWAFLRAYRVHWERLLAPEEAERLEQALIRAALAHDWGKAATGFQQALQGGRPWEFRHEVLSAALMQALGDGEDFWTSLALIAVLTHHRPVEDPQLLRDAGHSALPDLDAEVSDLFRTRAQEMEAFWEWLRDFIASEPSLRACNLPPSPENLSPPHGILAQWRERIASLSLWGEEKEPLLLVALRGGLMAADHAVSAGVQHFATEIPRPSFPPLRRFQQKVGSHRGDAFLEAPTGSGKTIAALQWALTNREGGERIFYLLPYQASIEAMARTLRPWFEAENVAVLHARAMDYAFREYFEATGEYRAAYERARAEVNVHRLVHRPLKVATPFQILKWLFGVPRFEIGLSEMVGGLFIFDEIHTYDAHTTALIGEMVRVLKRLGGRCLFMSATFPSFLRALLTEALADSPQSFRLEACEPWARRFLQQARHHLRWRDNTLEEMVPEILAAAREGKRVLVVANRVAQAQELYQALRAEGEGVHLLHGRFTRRDRTEKESRILRILRRESEEPLSVLVATQVVEVSLDVSFDLCFTEIAPVDDLLQRFGRVNRYGEHREGVEVHVATKYDEERVRWVYDLERLTCTLQEAPEDNTALTVPTMQCWVERVYREGWTARERERFEQVRATFSEVLESLRPLIHHEEGAEEFRGLFQSVEVLPSGLYDTFHEHWENREYLLATQLLVPIPWGWFHALQYQGRLARLERERVWLAEGEYDPEVGFDPRQTILEAQIC